MIQLVYDGSFEGFLSAVFEVYECKLNDLRIISAERYQPLLKEERLEIVSSSEKSNRVWKGLKKKMSADKLNELYKTFLSERSDREIILLEFIRHVFNSKLSVEQDFSNSYVLQITQIAKQVHREKHRMEAFVRFERTKDDLYFSSVEPDFNVLPLIIKHFKERYADQHWIIYDTKRKYGIQYNKESGVVTEVVIEDLPKGGGKFLPTSIVHEEEIPYQQLWKKYFSSVNISPRNNRKLHIRHVPLRYWKFLTEKH